MIAPKTLKGKVRIDHIRAGSPCCGDKCPVALALKEVGFCGVSVNRDGFTGSYYRENGELGYFGFAADDYIQGAIHNYDHYRHMYSFLFEVDFDKGEIRQITA